MIKKKKKKDWNNFCVFENKKGMMEKMAEMERMESTEKMEPLELLEQQVSHSTW